MKKIRFIVSLLILLSVFNTTGSAKIKDAFVLVDVSGTMKNSTINREAKMIIREYLLGNRALDSWENNGWTKDKKWDSSIPSSFIEGGSKVCLIPFGNIDRVHDRSKYTINDMNGFSSWLNSSFPSVFKDSWTYLTLAHAYIGSVALTEEITEAYVIVYTDGMPECVNEQYNTYDQERVDDYLRANSMRKLGILRKRVGEKHYDIEFWKFVSFLTLDESNIDRKDSDTILPPHKLKITTPVNKGLNEKKSLSIEKEDVFSIAWNESGASVIIYQKKDGNEWNKISGNNARNFYAIDKQSRSAKITFLESGDYKILVKGAHGSDVRYVSVFTSPLKVLLPIFLVVLAIIVGVLVYKYIIKDNNDKNKGDGSASTTIEDW